MNNILVQEQFDFRKDMSIDHAASSLTTSILQASNDKHVTAGIFVTLCVNNDISG
jgi:hypothetical protein